MMTTNTINLVTRPQGGRTLQACLAAPGRFRCAVLAWKVRRQTACSLAMLDDHLRNDLGLPPRPERIIRSVRFI